MNEIISYAVNVIVVIALIITTLNNKGIFNKYKIHVLSKNELVNIYETITDVIEVGEIAAKTYDEYKEKSTIEIYLNVIQNLSIADNNLTNEIKVAIYDKIVELLNDKEIDNQLQLKFNSLIETVNNVKEDVKEIQEKSMSEISDNKTDISSYL